MTSTIYELVIRRHVPRSSAPRSLWIASRALKTITLQSTRKSLANLKSKAPGPRPEGEETSDNYYADGLSKRFSKGRNGPRQRELLEAGMTRK